MTHFIPRRRSRARVLLDVVPASAYKKSPRAVPPHAERRDLAGLQSCSPLLVACPTCGAAFGCWCRQVGRVA